MTQVVTYVTQIVDGIATIQDANELKVLHWIKDYP